MSCALLIKILFILLVLMMMPPLSHAIDLTETVVPQKGMEKLAYSKLEAISAGESRNGSALSNTNGFHGDRDPRPAGGQFFFAPNSNSSNRATGASNFSHVTQ